ncbi:MAG: hypothetical protein CR989_00955 [Flavobacteriales bacterium]|nr:MAG: hypothetical protein CR989_00955 [Flavobacteriales bacterium]
MDKFQLFLHTAIRYFIYALALFPLLPRGVESVFMISILVLGVIYYVLYQPKSLNKKKLRQVIIFGMLFFIYLLTLTYSENLTRGLKYLKTVLPILIFPVIFGVFLFGTFSKKQIAPVFNIYLFAVFFYLCFIQGYLYFTKDTAMLTDWEYRNAFETLTDVHGTYFSIWIAFALFIAFFKIEQHIKQKKYFSLVLISGITIYLIYWQLKIGARFPQIITVLLLLITFFKKTKKIIYKLVGVMAILFYLAFISYVKPNFLVRMKELVNYNFSLPKGDYNYDFETITNEQIRNGIYFCSLSLIESNWLTGYGIGDVDDELQNCYETNLDCNVYVMFNYNSHNQYFHVFLAAGIIGLLLFIVSLSVSIYVAYSNSNWLYLLFSLLIFFSLLTENVLSRHDGVLFYSFFNAIFAFVGNKCKLL